MVRRASRTGEPTIASRQARTEDTDLKGKVKRLVKDRGFGFIEAENGNEIFFHASSLEPGQFDTLTEGDSVEFDVENDPRSARGRAANVRVQAS